MTADEIIEALNQYKEELSGILERFTRDRSGIHIDPKDNYRLRGITTEVIDLLRDHVPGSGQHIQLVANSYNSGISNFFGSGSYSCVEEIKSTVVAVMTRISRHKGLFEPVEGSVPGSLNGQRLLDDLDQLVIRFHAVVVQLRERHSARPTLDVNDEYDVQDLLHALLRIHFDDVRPEEWVPSYAGAASRTDFLLPQIDTVIETKKTRQGMTAKTVGEQLIIDIARYRKHPQCRRLVCFVYDPEGRISNPAGIESDLNGVDHEIEVRVFILPKAA